MRMNAVCIDSAMLRDRNGMDTEHIQALLMLVFGMWVATA